MKGLFANIWTKRFFSVIGALYAVGVCMLCYYSIFYNIHIEQKLGVLLMVTGISVLALVVMLYTRKQIVTRIASFIILPAMLPVVLLYFGQWQLIIPIIVTGVMILLLSGAGEGAKTALGTVILLLYIFGALGYFLFTSFFVTSAKQTEVASGVSPSGRYRFSVINTEDTSNGSTAIYIEPNYADVTYPLITFTLKNISRVVYLDRPICENIDISWETQQRQDITAKLNELSDNISVHLTEDELLELGRSADSRLQLSDVNVYELMAIGKTARDVEPLKLDDLSDEQLANFDIGRDGSGRYYALAPTDELLDNAGLDRGDTVYLGQLSDSAFEAFNYTYVDSYGAPLYTLEKVDSVPLGSLSDQQLASLGISDSGDVMIFNGKVVFRYYVAEIDDYFDVDSRHLSLDLLSN